MSIFEINPDDSFEPVPVLGELTYTPGPNVHEVVNEAGEVVAVHVIPATVYAAPIGTELASFPDGWVEMGVTTQAGKSDG